MKAAWKVIKQSDLEIRLAWLDNAIESESNPLKRLDYIQERINLRKKLSVV